MLTDVCEYVGEGSVYCRTNRGSSSGRCPGRQVTLNCDQQSVTCLYADQEERVYGDFRFGRKPATAGCLLVGGVSGAVASFSVHIIMYIVLRFICAISFVGVCLTTYCAGMYCFMLLRN